MKNFYRIMLGRKSIFAEESFKGNFVGANWFEDIDLTNKLPENWRDFNREYVPIYMQTYANKTKVAAGLACGMLHTIAKGMNIGDIVICPNGSGSYYVGEVTSNYQYQKGTSVPHRRNVNWFPKMISREDMSESLKNSTSSTGTVANVTKHSVEIESLIAGDRPITLMSTDETVEDPSIFALERHLEDFLVQNWHHTDLGKHYDIFEEDGEIVGQQYPSDTGPIDILAISKDKKELVVVELKKGRASDTVVGQIQRYMGYVKEELAESNQNVRGVIIAFEDDVRIHRALSVTNNIDFYTYKVSFRLEKKSK